MSRQTKEINPSFVLKAIGEYARRARIDIDLKTVKFESVESGGFKCFADCGKIRVAVTTQLDGKRTVIGWGDTEGEAWKMAKEHPRRGGHSSTWNINEATFDKIAAGDFDASGWSEK